MLRTVYFADGRYQPEALQAATHHLRDWRDNTTAADRPARCSTCSGRCAEPSRPAAPIQVFCGYRSPETNAMLRRTHHGAALHSLHMRAMAIDLHVPDRPLAQVRRSRPWR